jgi:hypothetical protein
MSQQCLGYCALLLRIVPGPKLQRVDAKQLAMFWFCFNLVCLASARQRKSARSVVHFAAAPVAHPGIGIATPKNEPLSGTIDFWDRWSDAASTSNLMKARGQLAAPNGA